MNSTENHCQVCNKEAYQKCSRCQIVYYCGKDHQKQHWKGHKASCRSFMIEEDNVLGRHLIASRDIKAGEIILREKPLIRGPSQITSPVCLGCLQFLAPETSMECPECGWPVCKHKNCHLSKDHQPECRWTSKKRKNKVRISQFVSPHPSYECISTLRVCYQKGNNQELWEKLCILESHCNARKDTPKFIADRKSIAEFLHRFYNIQSDFSIDEILAMCGKIEVNGHEVPTTEPPHVAIYYTTSMLEHSCKPNCSKSFTKDGDIIIHTAVPIKKGEHLSICYTDGLWSTGSRRQHLLETKFFSCRCDRCLDPTEFNTHFSAIVCDKTDCKGPMLPPSFCDGGTVAWQCIKCKGMKEWTDISNLLDKIGWEMDKLDKENTTTCTKFLKKWENTLHPNHFYLTEISLALAQQLGQVNGITNLSEEEIDYKLKMCKHLISLVSTLTPGECRIKGVLWFELHTATAEVARRKSKEGSDGIIIQQLLMESKEYLEKTIFCLQHEPDIMPEGKLLIEAKKILTELSKVLEIGYGV